MKKISVCMATRNGGRFIQQQLSSILSQLSPYDEVIISDDSSADDTVDTINSCADPRIVLLPGNTFYSPVFNVENALKKATGEIIVLSDQDDEWLEGKVATIRKHFEDSRNAVRLISLDGIAVDEDGNVIAESLFKKLNAGPGLYKNVFNNTYMGCCLAFSRELLSVALPFPRMIPMHDMWLGLLAEIYGEVQFVPEKTILYRKHAASVTDFKIRFIPITQIKRRWYLAYYLVQRSFEIRKKRKNPNHV